MAPDDKPPDDQPNKVVEKPGEDEMKKIVIVVLTAVFVVLYVLAIVGNGWNPNDSAVRLLQPIVYVIIGYFFGRMPSEANEKAQRAETDRQAGNAKAAREAEQSAVTKQAALKTKIRGAQALLGSPDLGIGGTQSDLAAKLSQGKADPSDALRHTVAAALQLLEQ